MKTEMELFLKSDTLNKIVFVIIGIVIIWLIIRAIQRFFVSKIKQHANRYKANKLSVSIGYILCILLLIFVYSNKLGSFTVALGIAGAGIAFALQEVIVSFAGWLAILIGGLYKTGDRVQLGGIKGDVMDIGILRTTIMELGEWIDGDLYNGRMVFVSNSFVFKEPVFNYSADFTFLWDEIKIPIQYGSNYDKTKIILLKIGKEIANDLSQKSKEQWNTLENKYRLEDTQTEPIVSIIITDNWVEYTLRYVVNYKKRRITKTNLFTQILNEIEATNGEIKFASNGLNSQIKPKV